jgi:hypothetical protein
MRMQRRRISHQDVPRFLGQLKDEGATRVRREPDGDCHVLTQSLVAELEALQPPSPTRAGGPTR